MNPFADELLARFRWVDGHADVLGLLSDGQFLRRAVDALIEPFHNAGVMKVAGLEARGFVLGAAVALRLGAGFVPVRKEGSIHPGAKAVRRSEPDWRGNTPLLQIQRSAVETGDRVLLVDDWAELGSQALATRLLLEECDAEWIGATLLVDQLADDVRRQLEPVAAVVRYEQLPSG